MGIQSVIMRADASLTIGTGHVMRCLALADALAERGTKCHFVCANVEGHLGAEVIRKGHGLTLLAPGLQPATNIAETSYHGTPHASWLAWSPAHDAVLTRQVAQQERAEMVVVDHYALGGDWEEVLSANGERKVLAIDDLADRHHTCDYLLDQNLGRSPGDYRNLVRADCQLLLGPRYALLRPAFAACRAASLARRREPELQEILISMGGVDKDNLTARALKALATRDSLVNQKVTVVLGVHSPWLDAVKEDLARYQMPSSVLVGVSDIERLMVQSDLAIGAFGSTAWERCCLGLPSIAVVLAENQRGIGRALANRGCALLVEDQDEEAMVSGLQSALCRVRRPEVLRALSVNASIVCDGLGTQRVIEEVLCAGESTFG